MSFCAEILAFARAGNSIRGQDGDDGDDDQQFNQGEAVSFVSVW